MTKVLFLKPDSFILGINRTFKMDNLTAEMIVMRKNLEYLQDNTNHFFLIAMACIIFRKYRPSLEWFLKAMYNSLK